MGSPVCVSPLLVFLSVWGFSLLGFSLLLLYCGVRVVVFVWVLLLSSPLYKVLGQQTESQKTSDKSGAIHL